VSAGTDRGSEAARAARALVRIHKHRPRLHSRERGSAARRATLLDHEHPLQRHFGDIYVGDDTFFARNCQVLTWEHCFFGGSSRPARQQPVPRGAGWGNDIRIGKGCFIGPGAIVLKGVTIGDHAIVGANAVANWSFPAGCMFAARVVQSAGDRVEAV